MPHPVLDNFHVVLVEPQNSLNIGSVARAMKNLGFQHLHLVAPPNFDIKQATVTGRWALDLIESAKIHASLPEALLDMQDVIGLASRLPESRVLPTNLPEWTATLRVESMKRTALVFGREDHGLRNEHLEHCRALMRIPSSSEYPSFNLAQAVLLVLFEVSRITWPDIIEKRNAEFPTWNEFYHLDKKIEHILELTGFYRKGTPEPIPALIKNLFRRTSPDEREMRVLMALFSRIEKTLGMDEVKATLATLVGTDNATEPK